MPEKRIGSEITVSACALKSHDTIVGGSARSMCVYILNNVVEIDTVDTDIFTVNLFSLYSRLVNNREIKLTLIIQRQLQYYLISAAIVKIKYAK